MLFNNRLMNLEEEGKSIGSNDILSLKQYCHINFEKSYF